MLYATVEWGYKNVASNETHASNFTEQMTNFPVKSVRIMHEYLHIKEIERVKRVELSGK